MTGNSSHTFIFLNLSLKKFGSQKTKKVSDIAPVSPIKPQFPYQLIFENI
jgi:hypothetical protein